MQEKDRNIGARLEGLARMDPAFDEMLKIRPALHDPGVGLAAVRALWDIADLVDDILRMERGDLSEWTLLRIDVIDRLLSVVLDGRDSGRSASHYAVDEADAARVHERYGLDPENWRAGFEDEG